jgi:hypothetical protein
MHLELQDLSGKEIPLQEAEMLLNLVKKGY